MIPRTFDRIWIGGPEPDEYRAYAASWADLHPGWEVRTWGEAEIDAFGLENRELYERAVDYTPAERVGQLRSDVVRYELLWRLGGVYVDADFEALRSIEPLISGVEAFAAWEEQDRWIANGLMGAVPRHPFIRRLIDGLPRSAQANRGKVPSRISGPKYLTEMWREFPELHVIETKFVYPYLYSDVGTSRERGPWPDAFAVHHWNRRRTAMGLR